MCISLTVVKLSVFYMRLDISCFVFCELSFCMLVSFLSSSLSFKVDLFKNCLYVKEISPLSARVVGIPQLVLSLWTSVYGIFSTGKFYIFM